MSTVINERREIALFPLGTVLFPGGRLPLKIFEQRYLDMTKACLRDNTPFGVCLISEGKEVGDPATPAATPHAVGCLAVIEQWDMPNPSMFHLLARGGERFRVLETRVAANGLLNGVVEPLPSIEPCAPDLQCVQIIERVIASVGKQNFPGPICLDEGAWVAYRIAEMMNFPMALKQQMLEMTQASNILDEIKNLIKSNT